MATLLKFGRNSLIHSEGFRQVGKIIKSYNNPVVVLSGIGDTSNKLKHLLDNVKNGNHEMITHTMDDIHSEYHTIIDNLILDAQANDDLKYALDSILYRKLNTRNGLVKQLMQDSSNMDSSTHYICNNIISISEQISCHIMSEYLNSQNNRFTQTINSQMVCGRDILLTTSLIHPYPIKISDQYINHIIPPLIKNQITPIITNNYARDINNNVIRFGGSSTNLTPMYIAGALNINKLNIFNIHTDEYGEWSVEKNKASILNVLEQDTYIVNNLDTFTLGKTEQFDYSILKYLTKNTDMKISIKNTMYPSYPGMKVVNNL